MDPRTRAPALLRRVHLPDRRAQRPAGTDRGEPASSRIAVRDLRPGRRWQLLLVSIPAAAWIWLPMYDLKAHVLKGHELNAIKGAVVVPICLGVIAGTMLCFYLNAVFAFAVDGPRPPRLRGAFVRARENL